MSDLPRPAAASGLAHADARPGEVERETAALVSPKVGHLNEAVLALLVVAHPEGLTATEALDAYLAVHPGTTGLYSVHPRLSQLERMGWCEKAGRRQRPGELPRTVYRLTSVGALQIARQRIAAADQAVAS